MKKNFFSQLLFILLSIILFMSCSSMKEIHSFTPSNQIKIDGLKEDWDDKSVYIEEANMSLMISNDDNFLYIYAATTEKMPFLSRGLTIWIDSTGGKDTYFGIHFPLGSQSKKMQFDIPNSDNKFPDENNPAEFKNRIPNNPLLEMDRFEIVGSNKKDKKTFYLKDDVPIKLAVRDNQFFISYEAKIPLYPTENFKYAINPGNNKIISLGFEFGEMESKKSRSSSGFGGPGGPPPDGGGFGSPGGTPPDGSGGFGGPGGSGRSGRGNTRGSQPPGSQGEQYSDIDDFWLKVSLK